MVFGICGWGDWLRNTKMCQEDVKFRSLFCYCSKFYWWGWSCWQLNIKQGIASIKVYRLCRNIFFRCCIYLTKSSVFLSSAPLIQLALCRRTNHKIQACNLKICIWSATPRQTDWLSASPAVTLILTLKINWADRHRLLQRLRRAYTASYNERTVCMVYVDSLTLCTASARPCHGLVG
jgi:hypothetical protein